MAAAAVRRRLMDEMEAGELEAEVIGAFTQEELPEILAKVDVMFAMYAPLREKHPARRTAREDV